MLRSSSNNHLTVPVVETRPLSANSVAALKLTAPNASTFHESISPLFRQVLFLITSSIQIKLMKNNK